MFLFLFFLFYFICSISLYFLFIPKLKRIKIKQTERSCGPSSHKIKNGTPTMGGLLILITMAILFSLLLIRYHGIFNFQNTNLFILLFPPISYALIGFLDDFFIIIKKNNKGLNASVRLFLEMLTGIVLYIVLYLKEGRSSIYFFAEELNLGFLYGFFILFILVGCANAANLTDGIDGLLGGTMIISYLALFILSMFEKNYLVSIFSISIILSLVTFLFFNMPRARLFMGNVGSLMLGAGLVGGCIALKKEILLFFFGFPYFIETISVIFQVWFFKRTKGKRILRMAPIHHHLELCKFSELEIDFLFYLTALAMCAIGVLIGIKL